MICIKDKKDCCGCNACVQKCPKHCISMQEDEEGFLYPKVKVDECIKCGLCETVCPVLNQKEGSLPISSFAAQNTDDYQRLSSSSGGVFVKLAEYILDHDGVVIGVELNTQYEAQHCIIEQKDDLPRIMTSKYVQSKVGDVYKETKNILEKGRTVLFSGTPCQISGLHNFLGKDYDKLYTIEVVCHGAPSPQIWREYLSYINPEGRYISSINFRDKTHGWRKFSMAVRFEDGNFVVEHLGENIYLQGFLKNLYLRPSCHNCPARSGKSHSDLSLGDFWGVSRKIFSDDGGTSAVLVGSNKGLALLHEVKLNLKEVSLQSVLKENPCINHSVPISESRKVFWNNYIQDGIKSIEQTLETMKPHGFAKIVNALKAMIKSIIRK